MPGASLQLARLAREIANAKGRLSFLRNFDRTWKERVREKVSPAALHQIQAMGIAAGPIFGSLQYQILCAFLGGLFAGCLLSTGCVSLGIWTGNTV